MPVTAAMHSLSQVMISIEEALSGLQKALEVESLARNKAFHQGGGWAILLWNPRQFSL